MRALLISLAALWGAVAVTSAAPAFAGPRPLPARLDFILLCKTSISEVAGRLGAGKATSLRGPWESVGQGWYHSTEQVYLLVYRFGDDRGVKGPPAAVAITLATAGHLKAEQLTVGDLTRSRLSLMSLRGPNGIRLGDSKGAVSQALGAGQLVDRRADVETYNHYLLYRYIRRTGCADEGFILQATFTSGRLTRIHILEAS